MKPEAGRQRRLTPAAVALFALASALAVGFLWLAKAADPLTSRVFPPCLFREITGLYCAGCGSARALHFLLNGHLWAAFRMNALAVLLMPFLLWALGLILYRFWKRRPLPRFPSWFPWAAIAVIVLFTVARNLPWMPFSWLAPTSLG